MFDNLVYDLPLANRIRKVLHHEFIALKIDKLPISVKISYLNLDSMEAELHMSRQTKYHCLRIYNDMYNYYGIKNIKENYIQIHKDKIVQIYNRFPHWREVARHYIVTRGSDFFDAEKHEQFIKDIEIMEKDITDN